MQKESIPYLSNNILHGLSSLICLEDKSGTLLFSTNRSAKKDNKLQVEYQHDHQYLIADPRINFIKQILKILFSLQNNRSKLPYSFRLKELKQWLTRTVPASLLAQMSWACKANCIFCFQKGNPPFLKIKCRMSKEEIKTRLKYFNARQQLGLVGRTVYENDEILTNPHLGEILKAIRKKTSNQLIDINTNGTALTPKLVRTLARAHPVILSFSLNSADPKRRKWIMNDPHPEVAIRSLPYLKKNKIPFVASIVVWPGLPFSDIKNTICYAEQNDACLVRLSLPGYSRFFPKNRSFNARQYWLKAIKHFYPMIKDFSVPVLIVPHMFVQTLTYERIDLPKIIGVIKNSPAYDQGFKHNDLIKEINGKEIDSIEEAVNLLRKSAHHKAKIKIERNKSILEFNIRDKKDSYPYCFQELRKKTPFGFVLADRYFSHDDIKDIDRYARFHDAKNVLVLCSAKARPYIDYLVKKYNIARTCSADIRVETVNNQYYGGSINTGDLLVTEDFIKCIRQKSKSNKPDLIILPSSPFSSWDRDLIGRVNLDIQREFDIPIEFVTNSIEQLLY